VKFCEFPKILIVTEKLLTGFDAPILYVMYLDKPMRDHTLPQAIARVNRPSRDPGSKYGSWSTLAHTATTLTAVSETLYFDILSKELEMRQSSSGSVSFLEFRCAAERFICDSASCTVFISTCSKGFKVEESAPEFASKRM
jgi:hypothetical protein